jgi:hypothetical protein
MGAPGGRPRDRRPRAPGSPTTRPPPAGACDRGLRFLFWTGATGHAFAQSPELTREHLVNRSAIIAILAVVLAPAGCFRGAEREKQPPPGSPGGQCAAPDGRCKESACNREKNYCYDPGDPCLGFFCGGSDRGTCHVVDGLPSCTCNLGYDNQQYELYCCPQGGIDFDELCASSVTASGGGQEEDDGDSSSGESTGGLDDAGGSDGTDW